MTPDSIHDLERRIRDLFAMITERRIAGIDTTALEALWISMLNQYETLVNEKETI